MARWEQLTAAWWGIVPAVVIGGGVTIAVSVLWARLFPVLRHLDPFPAAPPVEPEGGSPAMGG